MRKIILLCVFALIASTGFSQTEKGKFLISGASNLSFMSNKTTIEGSEDQKVDNLNLNASLGYFIAKNFALTGDFEYLIQSQDDTDVTTNMMLGGARAYIDLGKVAKLYFQGGVGLLQIEVDNDSFSKPASDTGFAFGLGGGVSLFIKDYLSIDMGLSYKKGSVEDIDMSNAGFSAGFSFYF